MKRKLFAILLGVFAMMLLMGASAQTSPAALVADTDDVWEYRDPEGLDSQFEKLAQAEQDEASSESKTSELQPTSEPEPTSESEPTPELQTQTHTDNGFLIDGIPAPEDTARTLYNGVTYVALANTVRALYPNAQVDWDNNSRTATVTNPGLTLTAKADACYVQANDRYLYVQNGVLLKDGRLMVPLNVLTEAFDAQLTWDGETQSVQVIRGDGVLAAAAEVYDEETLFWLSRIIYAESGNQPIKGQMAVGNVILNRVNSPAFPDNIVDVLAQKNQFSTYRGGALAEREPNASSILAAKLVLDGGVVEEVRGALYFDSSVNSWAAGIRTYLNTIGAHTFYQ